MKSAPSSICSQDSRPKHDAIDADLVDRREERRVQPVSAARVPDVRAEVVARLPLDRRAVRLRHPRLVEVEVDPVEPVHQALAEVAENQLEVGQLVQRAGVDDPHRVDGRLWPNPSPGPGIAQP